ncbi:MAG: hypothetical protein Q4B77_05825 [Coriobacteriaceae bacterium]|nr:hypothetical protein [Coriobacteriaceae bacterium]
MATLTVDLEHAERVGLADAKANLSGLVARVEQAREACVMMRYNRPAALLVPLPEEAPRTAKARGMLSKYADPSKLSQEEGAFARAVIANYADPS